jgi:SNF2 family DNA or RNA helicase
VDPWWNAAVEQQAMDRVYRIGQKRPVRVYRFVMKDSLEERMLNIQEAKLALGKGSMEKLSAEEKRQARMTALQDLFEAPDSLFQDWLD